MRCHLPRRHSDEVDAQRLADVRHAAARAQVALDDGDGVVLGQELHVKGTCDVQCARDALAVMGNA